MDCMDCGNIIMVISRLVVVKFMYIKFVNCFFFSFLYRIYIIKMFLISVSKMMIEYKEVKDILMFMEYVF